MTPLLLLSALACAPGAVDRVVVERVVDRAVRLPDVQLACTMGLALEAPLSAATPPRRPPEQALIVAETVGALCGETEVREAELEGLRARRLLGPLGEGRAALAMDARLREQRAHQRAAARYGRAWDHTQAVYGNLRGACPDMDQDEEFVYLLGMFSGLMGLLHERRGEVSVRHIPDDTLSAISSGATCLNAERWWQVPTAMQVAVGAVIPGAGPDGVDPWDALEDAAGRGARSGVRLSRALQVLLAANAGREEEVEAGIRAHAQALTAYEPDRDWALLDAFAYEVSLHESDLIWTGASGHRTEVFGLLPSDPKPQGRGPDADPFAADPFAP
ncbi:MAG: hypothetical protein JXX28_04610 [Deltaproteobacteria bacterium]|nr:hypothetical protein [Deltaproteobacteria bacterium]